MNKTELVEKMVGLTGFTKKDTERFVQIFQEVVIDELADGGKVSLIGFGTFEVTDRKERVGRNPKSGDEIIIPACKSPKFKVGSKLKEAVKGK